jgi:hypothetical protein
MPDETVTGVSGRQVVEAARQYIGKFPYVYGGTSLTSGADCSGFIQSLYATLGVAIPRDTVSQLASGTTIDAQNVKPGDCVYFGTNGDASGSNGHVGIVSAYLGANSGTMIDCAPSQGGVGERPFSMVFGRERIMGYRRYWSGNAGTTGSDGLSIGGSLFGYGGEVGLPDNPISEVAELLKKLVEVMMFPVKMGQWLTAEGNLIRLIQGFLGVAAMIAGVYFINADLINSAVGKAWAVKSKVEKTAATAAMAV